MIIALISVTTFGYTGYLANTLAFPPDVFPNHATASVWGIASMGSGFGGMFFMALSPQTCRKKYSHWILNALS